MQPGDGRVYDQARDISVQSGQPFSTAHILLALFVVPNRAESLLFEHGINEELLLASLVNGETEAGHLCITVQGRAAAFSDSTDSRVVTCLHLLAALTELPESVAYRLLTRCGLAPALVRARCLSLVSSNNDHLVHTDVSLDSADRTTASFVALSDEDDAVHVDADMAEETVETAFVSRAARAAPREQASRE